MAKSSDLDNVYKYHPPRDGQAKRYEIVIGAGKGLAEVVIAFCPESREREAALQKIEEAVMWANAAIARNV